MIMMKSPHILGSPCPSCPACPARNVLCRGRSSLKLSGAGDFVERVDDACAALMRICKVRREERKRASHYTYCAVCSSIQTRSSPLRKCCCSAVRRRSPP